MRRTRAADNTGSLPAMVDSETGGYHTAGPPATVFSADTANIWQEELVAIATMKGATLDTTGANLAQCKTAVSGAKAIEAAVAETSAVDTYNGMAVIASTNATVGEDAGGVTHAVVMAAQNCLAKGFESAVIASRDARAGDTAGNTFNAAVVASEDVVTEGNCSVVVASQASAGTATATADHGAIIASTFAAGATYLAGDDVAVIAALDSAVDGTESVIVGGDGNTVSDGGGALGQSAIVGGVDNVVAGDNSVVIGGLNNNIDRDQTHSVIVGGKNHVLDGGATVDSAILGGQSSTITDGTDGAIVGGNANTIDTNLRSVIAGGQSNTVARDECFIAASNNSTVPSTATAVNVTILSSKYCDSDAGGSEENYMVVGGYHASALTAPSWKIESNGGEIYATDTSVNAIDYAELFPNADGKAHEPGQILTRSGRGARLAKRGDRVLGAVSVTPTVRGGSDALGWDGMYLRDEWGAFVWRDQEEMTDIGPDPEALREKRRREKAHAAAVRDAQSEASKRMKRHAQAVKAAEKAKRPAPTAPDLSDLAPLLERGAAEAAVKGARLALRRLPKDAPRDEAEAAHAQAVAALDATPGGVDLSDLDLSARRQTRMVSARVLNPEWDREKARQHTPRTERPDEWTTVGLLGQVRVRVDATVKADSFVVPSDVPGLGTHSDEPGRGRPIECMEITQAFDPAKGYAVAFCLVG